MGMKFIVNEKLFEKYPNLNIGVLLFKGVDNTITNDELKNNFDTVINSVASRDFGELADYPVVHAWRDVYKSFGEKKARSSIEALIRRVVNGNEIPLINPLVDIYNSISLKYELPAGGEDLSVISGDVELTYADGSESFLPLGSEILENPNVGEIVYKFGDTIMCRNFNYRESDITKLTENSTDVILVMEDILGSDNLETALLELCELVSKYLGGSFDKVILNKNVNNVEF